MGHGFRKLWAACVVVGCLLIVVPAAAAGNDGDTSALGSLGDVVTEGVAPLAEAPGGVLDSGSAPAAEVVAPVVESVATPAAQVLEPVAEVVEPVVEAAQPVLDVVQPVVDAAAPIVDAVVSHAADTGPGQVVGGSTPSGDAGHPAAPPSNPITPEPVVTATPPVVIESHPEAGDSPGLLASGPAGTSLGSQVSVALMAVDAITEATAAHGGAHVFATVDPGAPAGTGRPADIPIPQVAWSPAGLAPGAIGLILVGLALLGLLIAVSPSLLSRVTVCLGAPLRPAFIALLERPG